MAARTTQKKGSLFQMNHALGQNILKAKNVVQNIVDAGEPQDGDIVLEIGPGTGNMTELMLERGLTVIAVEKDVRMAAELRKRFQKYLQVQQGENHPRLRIINSDILHAEIDIVFDLCISNIPYNISSDIVFMLLGVDPNRNEIIDGRHHHFRRAVLLVQKEFADRISARPGAREWGRLAVNTQLYANVRKVGNVSRKNFVPAPKVDSAIISIQIRENRPNIDFKEWDGLIKLCFNRPNRMLQATFTKKKKLALLASNREAFLQSRGMSTDNLPDIGATVQQILENSAMAQTRPITMDIEDFLDVLTKFNEADIHFQ